MSLITYYLRMSFTETVVTSTALSFPTIIAWRKLAKIYFLLLPICLYIDHLFYELQ